MKTPKNKSQAVIKLSSQANPRALKTHIRVINKNLEESEDLDRRIHVRYNEDQHELIVTSSSKKAIETFMNELPEELLRKVSKVRPANDNARQRQERQIDSDDDVDVFRRFFIASVLTSAESLDDFGVTVDLPTDETVLRQELEKLESDAKDRKKPSKKPKG